MKQQVATGAAAADNTLEGAAEGVRVSPHVTLTGMQVVPYL